MTGILNDLRLALRQLRKAPGFAVTAVLTLALGIGATTAIFTLVYDVLLKPLPYPQADRLVMLHERVAEFKDIYPEVPMNANHFENWQQNSRRFQAMAMMQPANIPLGTGGHPLQVEILRATSGIFPVLGVWPQIGRALTKQDDQPGQAHVVVLMHDLWRTQFHSDPQIVGKTITLDGYPTTVVGVMPRSFHLPSSATISGLLGDTGVGGTLQALAPLALTKEQLQETVGDFNYPGIGRLKSGISPGQAQAELNTLQHGISASLPAGETMTLSAAVAPLQRYLVGANTRPLAILLAAVAGLLFVGCINIANLLLARAVGRRQELAVACALGAGRAELVRASMRESAVLAIVGGSLGMLLAAGLVPVLQRFLPASLNFRGELHVDAAGAACALVLAGIATFLAGAAPAWMSWRIEPQEALRAESRTASESLRGKKVRQTLVATEVAVSVMLVLIAGLLTASLYHLMHVDRGFQAERVLTVSLRVPVTESEKRESLFRSLVAKLRALPGVSDAAIASVLPLDGDFWIDMAKIPGDTRSFFQMPTEHWRWISPGYFETLRLPLIEGRPLERGDFGKNYALVSAMTAKKLWPGQDPLGRHFSHVGEKADFTVVGVVADARTISLAKPDPPMIYVPYWYRTNSRAGLIVRTAQDPSQMADTLRRTVWSVDPGIAVSAVRSMGSLVAGSVATRRFAMDLLLAFAVCAWLLAGLGVYGVVTYSVVQRRQEIGLRMALGAQRSNIYSQVLREGLRPVLAGVVGGILLAYALARVVSSLLFDVNGFNPWISAAAAGSLLLAGIAACLLPARRAASVDPMHALRSE